MQLQGVVRGQGHVEAAREVDLEGVAIVVEEELVVAEGAHGDAHLHEVVQVLHPGGLAQLDAVVDLARGEEARRQVVHVPRLAAVGAELESVHAALRPQAVERR